MNSILRMTFPIPTRARFIKPSNCSALIPKRQASSTKPEIGLVAAESLREAIALALDAKPSPQHPRRG